MLAVAGGSSPVGRPLTWNLLFARQPDPDREFTETWAAPHTTVGPPSPIEPPNQSHRRPLLWGLVCVLIAGGAYVVMESELVTEYLGPLLDHPPAPQPSVSHNQTPSRGASEKQSEPDWSFLAPAETGPPSSSAAAPRPAASVPGKTPPTATPSKQIEQDWSFLAPTQPTTPSSPSAAPSARASAPVTAPPVPTSSNQVEQDWSFLAPDDTPAPSSPDDAPPAPASTPATTATASKQSKQDWSFLAKIESFRQELNVAPGTRGAPVPMFREGQRVSVRPDLNAPGWAILLRQDAEGTMPGPTILPGTVLTILDGDLQGRTWVYFVRSDIGSEGWLTEGQLRSKR